MTTATTPAKKPVRALVLTGDGINCEQETAQALGLAGFEPEVRHLNDLISEKMTGDLLASRYACLALPGGFSFGDDLTSGKVLALKIAHGLRWRLDEFAARGGLAIGICNGFQALIRLGVFGRDVSITHNSHGQFLNTWVRVAPTGSSKNVWLKGVGEFDVPIRHGEGRIVVDSSNRGSILERMEKAGQLCLKYEGDPNGSESRLAGLSDPSGRILGLMPHPEAFVRWTAHPEWTRSPEKAAQAGQGLALFKNAFQAAGESR